jgi:hypothetical protein
VTTLVAAHGINAAALGSERSLSDSSIAHNGAHRIKQAIGYQSGAVASAIEEDLRTATDAGLSCHRFDIGDSWRDAIEELKQLKGEGRSHKKRYKNS